MWLPIENDPLVLTKYTKSLGVKSENAQFVDVYGFSDDLLPFLARPVNAFLLVFSISKESELHSTQLIEEQNAEREAFLAEHNVIFMKQTTPNACGTVALLHALMNNRDMLDIEPNSMLTSVIDTLNGVNGLSQEPIEKQLTDLHEEAASAGSLPTAINPLLHFTCYVHCGGRCVELDGRQKCPILHNKADTNEEFIRAAGHAIESKMKLLDSIEYSVTALVNP